MLQYTLKNENPNLESPCDADVYLKNRKRKPGKKYKSNAKAVKKQIITKQLEAKFNRKLQDNIAWMLKKLGEANPNMKIDIGDLCATV
uniref:Uncharacterized protein n=1 Tax=Daucus carota subsp. sativus TaxID=79200 RepID=A0A166G3W6_DAUCS